MLKKFNLITLIIICILILTGCKSDKLEAPTNFKIEGNIASWSVVENATKYRVEFIKEGQSMKRVVNTNQINLDEQDLAEGTYIINVQALNDKDESAYTTDNLEYTVRDESKVYSFKEDELTNSRYIRWMGRTYYSNLKKMNMVYHTASGFEVKFIGTKVTTRVFATNYASETNRPFVTVVLDNDFENQKRIALTTEYTDLVLVDNITDNEIHTVTLYKSSESQDSKIGIEEITTTGEFIADTDVKQYKIEFIGDSGSCGFGNLSVPYGSDYSTEISDGLHSFASLTGIALDADFQIFAASGWGVKASVYTNPNTVNVFDAYKNYDFNSQGATMKYDFSRFTPDLVVINLGTNDYSYIKAAETEPTLYNKRLQDYKDQYKALVNFVHGIYPQAHIIMLHGLMNEGKVIADATNEMYAELKLTIPNLSTIEINGDGRGASNHPSAASHEAISKALVEHIKQTLNW